MPQNRSFSPSRRTLRQAGRRSRRRPLLLVGGLAVVAACTVGMSATAPVTPTASAPAARTFTLASYQAPTPFTPAVPAERTQARDAVATADASVQAALSVQADIAASGLDIGDPDPTVDTAALSAAAERLEGADALPTPFLPALTAEVAALSTEVDARVSALRGGLEGALQKKAAEEAAEKARQEAAAAAAAAAAARPSTGSSAPFVVPPAGTGDNSPAGAQATARSMLAARGWGDDQFSCLVSLWNKESGWRVNAHNASSGAYGIPQALPGSKMASAGADWQTSAATQVSWGLGYISGRYGTPCGAWQHSQSRGWY